MHRVRVRHIAAAIGLSAAVIVGGALAAGAPAPTEKEVAEAAVTLPTDPTDKRVVPAPTTTTTAPPPPPTTTTTTAMPSPPPPTTEPPQPSGGNGDPYDDASWYRLYECENGGYGWAANTGNGYYGGLQFSLSSWQSVGGVGMPHEASPDEQIARGRLLWEQGGWAHWPACTASFGWR